MSVPFAQDWVNRVTKTARRWSGVEAKQEKEERLRTLAETGETLQALMTTPGWRLVEEAKTHWQHQADRVMHTPSLDERTRFQASVEWAALEQFFAELRRRVREGQKAREALTKGTTQPITSGA